MRRHALIAALTLCLAPALGQCDNIFEKAWESLRFGKKKKETAPPPKTLDVGPYEILGEAVAVRHQHFERDLDAPDFFNFTFVEKSKLTGKKKTNEGACYGISIFTLRYYQWFILPHLLDDATFAKVSKAKKGRTPPAYARRLASAMKLPDWVLAPSPPSMKAQERRERIAPFRLRTYLKGNEALGKRFSGELFDNQRLPWRVGSRAAETIDLAIRKGKPAFFLMEKYVVDPTLGAFEINFWGAGFKWGHSIVGYKISEYKARKGAEGKITKAFRVDLFDSNDPTNYFDDAIWYFPDEKLFAPTKKYIELYDDVLAEGKQFITPARLATGAEQALLDVEANLFNKITDKLETIEIDGGRGR